MTNILPGKLCNSLLILFSMQSAVTMAASEFDEGLVPVEFVRQLAGREVYRGLPDDFPLPPLPGGLRLSVLGSAVSSLSRQVWLRNSAETGATLDMLSQAYSNAGWTVLTAGRPDYPYLELCHETLGMLDIFPEDIGSAEGLRVTHQLARMYGTDGPECREDLAYRNAGYTGGLGGYIRSLLPVLEIPDESDVLGSSGLPFFSSFSSGSLGIRGFSSSGVPQQTSEMSQFGRISLAGTSAAALHEDFMEQMLEQGWSPDSSGEGEKSAVSVWFRSASGPAIPGLEEAAAMSFALSGTLSVTALGEDAYSVGFRMISQAE